VVVQRENAVVMILEDQTEIVLEKKIGQMDGTPPF
jgi:hypothetical protein